MVSEKIGFEQFGGVEVEGGFDSLLAPLTTDEIQQDREDLLDLVQAERDVVDDHGTILG